MNVWGAYRYLRLTLEQSWGVFHGTGITPDAGATSIWIDLLEDAYVLDGDPRRWQLTTAGGGNMLAKTGSQRTGYSGRLKTPLFPSLASFLVPWFATPSGTGNARNLPSVTCDYFNGYEVKRTVGVRPSKGVLSCQDSDDGVVVMLELDLIGKSQVADGSLTLTEPAVTDFPTGRPYTLTDLAGQVKINNTAIATGIKDFKITYENILYWTFHESPTIDRLNLRGRRLSAEVTIGEEDRTNRTRFEQVTAVALVAGWSIASPASSVLFDLQGNCYVTNRSSAGAFGEDIYETLTFTPFRDGTSGLDGEVAIVEPA